MAPDLAWNTAVSFLTNTNWQFYSGEQAMSYLSQMAGLAWHNFVSRGRRHRDRGRRRARARADVGEDARKLLGRPDALLALRAAADRGRRRALFRVAGDAAESSRIRDGSLDRGLHAVDHRRPDGLAGGHQGARHQRRRLRQRELRIAQREPHAAYQSLRDAADLRARRRPDVHVRQDGQGHAPGLGDLHRDGDPVLGGLHGRVLGGGCGQPDRPSARRRRREHGRQGVPLRNGGLGALRDGDDRYVVRRGQLDARLLHAARRPRSARRTCSSARSSSAASAAACTG